MTLRWTTVLYCFAIGTALSISGLTSSSMAKSSQHAAESSQTIATGVWGGRSLNMEVTPQGATLEFDCADGKILEPMVVNAGGKFRVRGTFQPESGGPVHRDAQPAGVAIVYTGTVESNSMQIEFTLPGNSEPEGPFSLVRGKPGSLHKCN